MAKSKVAKTRDFSLRSDVDALLNERWLRPSEQLVNFHPVDGNGTSPGLDGIPVPRSAGQWVKRILFYTAVALLFVLLIPILVYALEGLGGSSDKAEDSRRRRPLYAWGDGRESWASRTVVPTLDRTGVWVLTDRRLAFLALNGPVTALSKHATGEANREAGPVEVEPLVEVAAADYAIQGRVERMHTTRVLRRKQPIGTYHRVVFIDGSGIELRNRFGRI